MAANEEQDPSGWQPNEEAEDGSGWEVDPSDENGAAVVRAVGRQIRLHRKRAGMSGAELGRRTGYGEAMIYKMETGVRIPRPEFLDAVDTVLNAGGLIAATKEDVAEVGYPKEVRELAQMENRAVDILTYGIHNLHGLLQIEEYIRELLKTRRPAYVEEHLERRVAARLARQKVFERSPAPEMSFIQEEVTLTRPIGGRMVLRRQLEHLLHVGRLPHVEIQVMPTSCGDHPGTGGRIDILKFPDGTGVGRMDDEFGGRPASDPRHLRLLELRYGIIRGRALTPEKSMAFIERLLGER
ncbi:helix-turn-helix transcriptional regulator [Streptomyces sp. LP05-1]|uniref:Helix-turn-helix transcriptional regulator n=1 Tax=Streptomyces pyxinae TaxID=2970734 RepID=A0ABT2CIF4_9ACTN|nr:helix-turn-helix transcriptional regulator [Streptomyces sp. LP05-1]MCS0637196.1 helix-turn-helix transcriptional regulator [Streptomyces sp. LP05-1]